ncbi:MAG TPA: Amuc_1098 family type IV pilus outer membrane protein [Chthoniobacterales bacterium]
MTPRCIVPALLIAVIAATVCQFPQSARAGEGYGSISGVAEREIARRQERALQAEEAIRLGDAAYGNEQYEEAVTHYKQALVYLPDAVTTAEQRSVAFKKFSKASVKLAEQRISEGRYQDAQAVLALALEYNPYDRDAKVILDRLAEPDYYNKTIGPKFIASVEEVKKYLVEADGFYDSGRYDLAFKRYEQVLSIDPTNVAARRGQEKIHKARLEYADEAYNEARTRAIWQVSKSWESPVKKYGVGTGVVITGPETGPQGTSYITGKLNRIIFPRIEFKDATIREAIEYLKSRSRDLDPEPDASRRGVNIVLKLESSYRPSSSAAPAAPSAPVIPGLETPAPVETEAPAPSISPTEIPITLSLSNVPMIEALKYITNLANLKYKIEPYAVSIVPLSEPTDVLITKQYQVPPGFITGTAAPAEDAQPQGDAAGIGGRIAQKIGAKEFLEGQGVSFPPGASAIYQTNGSRLIIKNTQENLDLIDTLVELARQDAPKQIEIESKFVEIQQTDTKELGFDWTLGAFNVDKSERVFASGGTEGNQLPLDPADWPFINPITGLPVGTNPVTGGNRSGTTAISANAIDALLFGLTGNSLKAPGIFGLAGVFTDPQFQVVIRALNQKKGVDLLSAPRVTTKSGMRAVIEIVREFRYPTEFDPPQIPQSFGSSSASAGTGTVGTSTTSSSFPVTPTTPTTFETRNVGVTLEVEPQVGPDGQTIDLTLAPSVTEFEGFINYGSPIQTVSPIIVAGIQVGNSSVVLTPNIINQPIFSSRKVQTQVSIWDGQTVVIGGLIREDVQKIEDKTPFLGDIPLIGRLFRSSSDQHIKRNLVVFVTARLMNPAGQPVNQEELEEEVVEPLHPAEQPPQPLPDFSKDFSK